jgi:hypothetical protein
MDDRFDRYDDEDFTEETPDPWDDRSDGDLGPWADDIPIRRGPDRPRDQYWDDGSYCAGGGTAGRLNNLNPSQE